MTREPSSDLVSVPDPPRAVPTWFFMRRMPALTICGFVFTGTGIVLGVLFHYLGLWTPPTIDRALDNKHATATGIISAKRFLAHTEIGSRHPWRVHFQFTAPNGATVEAVGYTFDQAMASKAAGDPVEVEYDPVAPERARPAGGRAALFPLWAWVLMLVLIGPEAVAGLLMLLAAWVRIRGERVLLARGSGVAAEVVRVRPVRYIHVGGQTPYDVRYRFRDDRGTEGNGEDRTYHFEWARSLKAGDSVAVIYNPRKPGENALWLHGSDVPRDR